MKRLKVLFVTPSFYPATYWGGPVYSSKELCDSLAASQLVDLRVLTTDTNGPSRKDRIQFEGRSAETQNGYPVSYCRRNWSISFSRELAANLPTMINWADVVHLTAVYSFPTIPTLALCKLLNKPVVWSPRGALQRWESSSRRKTKSLWDAICNALCEKSRVTLHFTSEKESSESEGRINRAAAVVIPNGVEIRQPVHRSSLGTNGGDGHKNSLRLLYLGRLHPIKGIENLLTAMRAVDPSVTLSICGNGDNAYERKLKAMVDGSDLDNRVFFRGHVTDEQKPQQFADSDVLVMPSFSESFGVSAAEAMSYGLPVIAGSGTPWSEIEKRGCGLWVDNDPGSLANAIKRISEMPLREMGERGQHWMASEYSWDVIAGRMADLYQRMIVRNEH